MPCKTWLRRMACALAAAQKIRMVCRKPTPTGVPLTLKARVDGEVGRKTHVLCEVYAGNILTALGKSILVRVDIGHLAKTAHG